MVLNGIKQCRLKITVMILSAAVICCVPQTIGEAETVTIVVQNPLGGTESTPPKAPAINSGAALSMDTVTGRVLFEKNGYSKRAMASTTKIMTGILAIERGNLDDVVTVSKKAAGTGGSIMGLTTGEKLTLRDLLYGLFLESGNDAAVAIAEHIGGSVENFAAMMNEKARELGAYNTSFKTPHGLDTEGHYTTCYDLALITRYALQNPIFNEYVKTQSAVVGKRYMHNTNNLLSVYPGADGVKTGYTGQAGRCLVSSATRDGWRVISVVLNSDSSAHRTQDSIKILDYSFNNYKFYDLYPLLEMKMEVNKGMEDFVELAENEVISYPMREDEYARMVTRVTYQEKAEAPVAAGTPVGKVEYILDGNLIGETTLYVARDVERKDYNYYFKKVLEKWMELGQGVRLWPPIARIFG